ncbi:inovirus Gp2 family protein [Shewanella algae]|uniref:inovirus Gp2 family protein n=1 Tax=Shewanella algae TaxID=38313 RepID=UPI001AAF4D56|nr:inovirus Gp2 family protein [Shewanella algae]MBO2583550.1 inovirus Gp2 family protein [Shewanella algae]
MAYPQLTNQGPLNKNYLKRIVETVYGALAIYPRLTVIRVDLRLPDNGAYSDNPLEHDAPMFFANISPNLIKRFIASLKAQIEAEQYAKVREGKRVHYCDTQHIWAREYSQNHKSHYHLALLFNKDRYHGLGSYAGYNSLAGKIRKAWASALGMPIEECFTLVHFPENPVYHLNHNVPPKMFMSQLLPLLVRLSYLAKEKTKVYGTGQRNFGCSNSQNKWNQSNSF